MSLYDLLLATEANVLMCIVYYILCHIYFRSYANHHTLMFTFLNQLYGLAVIRVDVPVQVKYRCPAGSDFWDGTSTTQVHYITLRV